MSQGTAQPVPFTFLTSWRLTVTLAIILVATVVTLKLTRGNDAPLQRSEPAGTADAPAAGAGLSDLSMKEMTALEKAVADKPDDAPAWLRLSNMLQDAKLYPRAIESYGKYLELKPDDPDARVDLGVTYYEYAISDSTKRVEYLSLAQKNFEYALNQNPKHQLAMFNLGIVFLQDGDMHGANTWFTKCAAVDTSTDTGKKAQMMIHQHTFSQQ
jgi:tetratricopeptide (TPR) repeat protein